MDKNKPDRIDKIIAISKMMGWTFLQKSDGMWELRDGENRFHGEFERNSGGQEATWNSCAHRLPQFDESHDDITNAVGYLDDEEQLDYIVCLVDEVLLAMHLNKYSQWLAIDTATKDNRFEALYAALPEKWKQ